MNYVYFPGCSLQSTGRPYDESMRAVFDCLHVPLPELEDWNCCGATAYMAISELKAFALSARNLALAEKQGGEDQPVEVVVPCAACYLGLNKASHYLNDNPILRSKVNGALEAAGLTYAGRAHIRHPLDVLVRDIGIDVISDRVARPLEGLKVACYYGCQLIRPYSEFDDQHRPTTMDTLMKAIGAEVIDWPLKTRCCGGSLTGTIPEVGQRLSFILVREARRRGCDVIATACPLCQHNLECYQSQMRHHFGGTLRVPVAYFTQILGLAFGLSRRELGLQRLFVPIDQHRRTVPAGGGDHVAG